MLRSCHKRTRLFFPTLGIQHGPGRVSPCLIEEYVGIFQTYGLSSDGPTGGRRAKRRPNIGALTTTGSLHVQSSWPCLPGHDDFTDTPGAQQKINSARASTDVYNAGTLTYVHCASLAGSNGTLHQFVWIFQRFFCERRRLGWPVNLPTRIRFTGSSGHSDGLPEVAR